MERLTKSELVNGFPVCYPDNDTGLPELVIKGNPYRKIVERLKEYEDSGMSPDQVDGMKDRAEDMAEHVCNELCRHPREITDREKLNEVCDGCPVDVYVKLVRRFFLPEKKPKPH